MVHVEAAVNRGIDADGDYEERYGGVYVRRRAQGE